MLITDKGVLVRTRVSEIRELGRATQGVTLIAPGRRRQAVGPATHRRERCQRTDANGDPETDAGPAGEENNS